jgi:acrylyl-CoA reductase (NADPH)
MQPYETRVAAWERLASIFSFSAYERMVTETGLEELPAVGEKILAGKVKGRVIVQPKH